MFDSLSIEIWFFRFSARFGLEGAEEVVTQVSVVDEVAPELRPEA